MKKVLEKLKHTADKANLQKYIARCYELQGNVYLNHFKYGCLATDEFYQAAVIYHNLEDYKNFIQTQYLAANSMVEKLMSSMIEIILKSENAEYGNNPYIDQIIDWSLIRKPVTDKLMLNELTSGNVSYVTNVSTRPVCQKYATEIENDKNYSGNHLNSGGKNIYFAKLISQFNDIKLSIDLKLLEQ